MTFENVITQVIVPIIVALIPIIWEIIKAGNIAAAWAWIQDHAVKLIVYALVVFAIFVSVYAFSAKPGLERINTTVSIYPINNLTEWEDDISFYNSQTLPIASNSRFVYVAVPTPDGYAILKLENNTVTAKIPLEGYYGVTALYADEPDIYAAVTFPKDGNHYYSFLKITDDGSVQEITEPFLAGNDEPSVSVVDFTLSESGNELWYLEKSEIDGSFCMKKRVRDSNTGRFVLSDDSPVNLPDDVEFVSDLSAQITRDAEDGLYFSVPSQGCVLHMEGNAQGYDNEPFAGEKGERLYNDKCFPFLLSPKFYEPGSLLIQDDFLYILDGGVVRRVALNKGRKSQTVAGVLLDGQKEYQPKPNREETSVRGVDAVFPSPGRMRLAANPAGGILLSDSSNGVIYQIQEQ